MLFFEFLIMLAEFDQDNKNLKSSVLKRTMIIVVAIVMLLISLLSFGKLSDYFLLGDDTIYYKSGFIGYAAFTIITIECTFILTVLSYLIINFFHYLIKKHHENKKQSLIEKQINEEKKTSVKLKETFSGISVLLLIVTFVTVLSVYCYFSDVTVVAENEITNKTPLTPFGNTYHFSDVTEYEVYEKDENPVLKLVMNDNHKIKIGEGYIESTRDAEHSYQHLCDIDDILKSNHVVKNVKCSTSDFSYYEDDKKYIDKLLQP